MTSTAWKNSSGTMLLRVLQSHSCDWKDKWLPKHAGLLVSGTELEKHSAGHEMSNHQHKTEYTWENW